jgi:hypothetical protein
VQLVDQVLLILLEHLILPPIFGGVCVAQFLVFCVVLGELLLDFFILVLVLQGNVSLKLLHQLFTK